jgi:hypothetical protein
MGRRDRLELEKPHLQQLIHSALDYFLSMHGGIVITIVRRWLEKYPDKE